MNRWTTPRLGLTALALSLFWSLASAAPAAPAQAPAPSALELEDNPAQKSAPETNSAPAQHRSPKRHISHRLDSQHPNDRVVYGHDVFISKEETVDTVAVFGGSATVRGKVRSDVSVFGGDIHLEPGSQIGGDARTFHGSITLQPESSVGGDAMAFEGSVYVLTNATVKGDIATFGGETSVDEGGTVLGEVMPFSLDTDKVGLPHWLGEWFHRCVLKLRPLAFSVPWVWPVAGTFFVLYLFIAAFFPRPVRACVEELSRRPASSFFMGLMTQLLLPLICIILVLTVVGLPVVLFVLAVVFVAAMVGKVALLEWFGLRLSQLFHLPLLSHPLLAFLVGSLLVTGLYLVPVVGLLAFLVLGVWSLGAVVLAAFGGLRRELPPKPSSPSSAQPQPVPAQAPAPASAPASGAPPSAAPSSWAASSFSTPSSPSPVQEAPASPAAPGLAGVAALPPRQGAPPVLPDILAYPKASFWERMGAGFLDLVLVSVLSAPLGSRRFGLLVALAYFAGMWAWKGTTIGGIVLGLKVVRQSGGPLSFAAALVRGLAGAFSMFVLFLGFLWIAWDPEKQGWHDRIAGTVVLRMPQGTPLLCL